MTSLNPQTPESNQEVQVDETRLAEVQEVVQELAKTIKIFRTYPRTNNMSITAIDSLVEVFSGYLTRRGALELFVDRHEIQWQGVAVHADTDQRRSFALKLDRDGVRRLVFTQGLDKDQIVGLLEALTSEIDEESLDDDLVTLLWDKQLQNIKVYVLDDMSSEDAFQQDLVGADGAVDNAPEKGASEGSSSTGSPTELALAGEGDPSAQLALCSAAKAKLHPVTEDQAQELHETATNEEDADIAQDLTEILFSIMRSKTQDEISGNALKVLVELAMMYVQQTEFAQSADILERLRSFAANDELENDVRAQVVEQLQALGESKRVTVVIETLNADVNVNLNDLARFLKMLPPEAAPGLCELMEIERYDEVVRSAISHLIREDPTVLTSRLAEPNVDMATKVLDILEQVAEPSLAPAVVDPLMSAEMPVKRASVKLLGKLKSPPARELLLNYVALDDPQLRKGALEALGQFESGGGPATALRQQVITRDFHERSLQDKKTLLTTLAKLEGHHVVDFLSEIIADTRWFEKPHHAETRACAALALGEVDSDVARDMLEKHTSDKQEAVRTATRLALSRSQSTAAVGT